nr:cytochrome P450 CYP736A12-like [Ipomoea batatas]
MIVGSVDTSFTWIEWTLAEIMRHPRVMKRLQEELETKVGLSRMVEEKDLPDLEYLEMVIKESFRLHPVATLLIPHESMEDIELDGHFIPKNTRVSINCWAIGHDPNIWSDNVEEFVPERFMNKNIDLRGRDFHLLPFGYGRRGFTNLFFAAACGGGEKSTESSGGVRAPRLWFTVGLWFL